MQRWHSLLRAGFLLSGRIGQCWGATRAPRKGTLYGKIPLAPGGEKAGLGYLPLTGNVQKAKNPLLIFWSLFPAVYGQITTFGTGQLRIALAIAVNTKTAVIRFKKTEDILIISS
jgi:hypothetical protein